MKKYPTMSDYFNWQYFTSLVSLPKTREELKREMKKHRKVIKKFGVTKRHKDQL